MTAMKNPLHQTAHPIRLFFFSFIVLALQSGCKHKPAAETTGEAKAPVKDSAVAVKEPANTNLADAATIISRKEVPILCYHQLRDWLPSDSKTARDYIVPVAAFREQMKSLSDSGYHTILPDELYDYLVKGKPLPAKPIMLTFDDTRIDQYNLALPELTKYGYKGVYFVMTVSLGRPGYMSADQIKQLSDEGNVIGSHTWDHHNVKQYEGNDWITQIEKPSQQLQKITGKPIDYFAYPFGLWNKEAIVQLKKHGFKSVFQLAAKMDSDDPLFTIRRIIVPGNWTGSTVQRVMKNSFK
jgi:peptidoglycan/xylan/chitin deacetylase (PgdA/CDA1 family)